MKIVLTALALVLACSGIARSESYQVIHTKTYFSNEFFFSDSTNHSVFARLFSITNTPNKVSTGAEFSLSFGIVTNVGSTNGDIKTYINVPTPPADAKLWAEFAATQNVNMFGVNVTNANQFHAAMFILGAAGNVQNSWIVRTNVDGMTFDRYNAGAYGTHLLVNETGASVRSVLWVSSNIFAPRIVVTNVTAATGTFGVITATNISCGGKTAMWYDSVTGDRGLAVRMTNKTGAASVKGALCAPGSLNENCYTNQWNEYDTFGVCLEAGIADGSDTWVMLNGVVQVLLETASTATNAALVIAATTDGRATCSEVPSGNPGQDLHFKEIGHCLENKAAGGLAKIVLHFN